MEARATSLAIGLAKAKAMAKRSIVIEGDCHNVIFNSSIIHLPQYHGRQSKFLEETMLLQNEFLKT